MDASQYKTNFLGSRTVSVFPIPGGGVFKAKSHSVSVVFWPFSRLPINPINTLVYALKCVDISSCPLPNSLPLVSPRVLSWDAYSSESMLMTCLSASLNPKNCCMQMTPQWLLLVIVFMDIESAFNNDVNQTSQW